MSVETWHAQHGSWQRIGLNPLAPGPNTSGKPVIGAAIGGNALVTVPGLEAQVGPLLLRRSYAGPLVFPVDFASSAAGMDVGVRESVWSFKPTPSVFATGGNDAWFSSFLDSIPSGHKTIIILWHEPEVSIINNHDFTLAEWQAANNHMGAMVHAKSRPELRAAICIQGGYTFNPSSGFNTTEFWDSGFAQNLDYIALDTYERQRVRYADDPYQLQAVSWATSHGKQVFMAEYGCDPDPNDINAQGAWILDSYAFGIAAGFYAMSYWDNLDTTIADAPSFQAFASINTDSKV